MLPIILIFLSSVSLFTFCDVSTKQINEISVEKAAQYLSNYGYMKEIISLTLPNVPSSEVILRHNSVTISDALKKFQKFAGLKPTGKLDAATMEKMQQKRCGRPDVIALRQKGKYKWEKSDLTYSIESLTSELSESEVRDALKKAFDTWSAVTRITLNEISEKADITIAFARRMHNDPWPFDGEGGILAHATLPSSGILHFDSDEKWVYMNSDAISRYDTTDVLQVAIHEIGHVLGLEHSADSDSIMLPFYRDTVDNRGNYITPKLSASDVRNIQYLYGINDKETNQRGQTTTTTITTTITTTTTTTRRQQEYGSNFGTDSSNDDNDFNSDKKIDINCPDEVDGIITTDGSNYLFSGNKVYEFDRSGVKKEYLLKNLFPNGPPFVQGALSNSRTDKTLLFHGKMVFVYNLEKSTKKFVLQPNYPKKLPTALNFKPMGAFLWHEGSQILINCLN
ncbi:Matrixin family protein [Brugia malayi]|uniref:Matrixin family protein n=1 Tax=Brugia malayi TaxID=6279 RepID=A0A4E9FSJ1_BRUMA|nr:Matrixin family protein [Brugia malayi]VIO97500.1 Matrixin family protein [Brugia malayi]